MPLPATRIPLRKSPEPGTMRPTYKSSKVLAVVRGTPLARTAGSTARRLALPAAQVATPLIQTGRKSREALVESNLSARKLEDFPVDSYCGGIQTNRSP